MRISVPLLLVVALFFHCQAPINKEAYQNFDWQGHRGARGLVPENTIPSFLKALEYPVRTLELDVVVTKDSQLVISHEPWMNAAFCSHPDGRPVLKAEEDSLIIFHKTLAEVQQYDCGLRGNKKFPQQQPQSVYKPGLRETILEIEEHCLQKNRERPIYNIEIKSKKSWDNFKTPEPAVFVQLLLKELSMLDIQDRFYIQSFDRRCLQVVKAQDPSISTALLVANVKGVDGNVSALGFKPEIYSPHYSLLTKGVVDHIHGMGMKVIPWTVNDPLLMKQMIHLGVDGIITDYPDYIPSN